MRQNMPRMMVDADADAVADAVSNLSTHNGSSYTCVCVRVGVRTEERGKSRTEWAIPRISLLTDMHMLCVLC